MIRWICVRFARISSIVARVAFAVFFCAAGAAQGAEAPVVCTESPVECGKRAFDAGVAAFGRGDGPTAVARFRQALELRPHPVIAFNLALAEAKSGLYVEAAARLGDVMRDPSTPNDIRSRAKTERDTVTRNIVTILVEPAGTEGVVVQVDGGPMSGTPPSTRVNPGPHKIHVISPGRMTLERQINLLPGETLRVTVEGRTDLSMVVGPPPPPKEGSSAPSAWQSHRVLRPAAFYIAAGATVVMLGVTTWSGLDTLAAYRSYDQDRPTLSQQQTNQRVDEGHSMETRTNVLVGVTAALAVGTAALGLFAVKWGSEGGTVQAQVRPSATGMLVEGRF